MGLFKAWEKNNQSPHCGRDKGIPSSCPWFATSTTRQASSWIANHGHSDGIPLSLPQCGDRFYYPQTCTFWVQICLQWEKSFSRTGKSHQNTSDGKFDPERAVLKCWLLALFNDVIVYDVTTHNTTLPATSPPLSMALNIKYFEQIHLKPHSISGTRKIINY